MNLRIDLLEDGERRHLGPVSPKFILYAGAGTTAALLALAVTVLFWNRQGIRSGLQLAQQRWAQIETERKAQDALRAWRKQADQLQAELDGWEQGRLVCHTLWSRIAGMASADWQAERLSYRDAFTARLLPGSADKAPQLSRRFTLTLTGNIRGEQANLRSAQLAQEFGDSRDGPSCFANPPVSQLTQQGDRYQVEIRGVGHERAIP